jgi:hypothetical protein
MDDMGEDATAVSCHASDSVLYDQYVGQTGRSDQEGWEEHTICHPSSVTRQDQKGHLTPASVNRINQSSQVDIQT